MKQPPAPDQPSIPRSLGYSMPPEWAPHEATWLSWPHNQETWQGKVADVEKAYVEIILALAPHERVNVLVCDVAMEKRARTLLESSHTLSNVRFHRIPTNDAWLRDSGPTFVTRPAGPEPVAMIHWGYNAWGGKWPPYDQDQRIPARIQEKLRLPLFRPDIIMEGGSIEVNGKGTVLTTESCLLNPNRNPNLTSEQIESVLVDHIGVSNVLWLSRGCVGDDTDGHIDNLARFVSEDTVVAPFEEDSSDENYEALCGNWERLQGMKDQDGKRLKSIKLPTPGIIMFGEMRLPASYANFYVANDVVLVPVYGSPNDANALGLLQELFPGRKAVGIRCNALIIGLGSIHCITQQQPR